MDAEEKKYIKYLYGIKRKYENSIIEKITRLQLFEIRFGKCNLCKELIQDYTNILVELEIEKKYYYEFCKTHKLEPIR